MKHEEDKHQACNRECGQCGYLWNDPPHLSGASNADSSDTKHAFRRVFVVPYLELTADSANDEERRNMLQ